MTFEEHGGPVAPKLPRNATEKDVYRRLIVVLDHATLEITRLGGGSDSSSKRFSSGRDGNRRSDDRGADTLLNCDDHQNILKKAGRDVFRDATGYHASVLANLA